MSNRSTNKIIETNYSLNIVAIQSKITWVESAFDSHKKATAVPFRGFVFCFSMRLNSKSKTTLLPNPIPEYSHKEARDAPHSKDL